MISTNEVLALMSNSRKLELTCWGIRQVGKELIIFYHPWGCEEEIELKADTEIELKQAIEDLSEQ